MIIKTLDQFQKAIPTAVAISNFADVEPYIRSAEMWIKNRVLGTDLYDFLDNDESSTDENTDVLLLSANVIANHAFWEAIPFLDLVLTDSGFAVISANNKLPASKERVERLREQCLLRRDSETELLIEYLENHIEYHDDWKSSPAYSILTDCLIRTATELQQYGDWEGSRREFMKLKPKLIHETMTRLEPIFSKELIEDLIELQRDGDLDGDNLKVATQLKWVLGCLVNGNIEAAEKIAADALRYIDANIESFPLYEDSQEYLARNTAGFENSADSPIFNSIW
mgnify:CR=1 FL=1